ncbi:MAG: response regulator, partial [Deltaproteobacteria bacterium]|nr:response regulator [Deltaproteobacteria bacterium]
NKPDIVFLDVMMPEMDGLEALTNIKQRYPEIVVIMITGNPSKENVQESIQGGASGFIVKPFNSAKVLDTLDRAWQNRTPPLPQRND